MENKDQRVIAIDMETTGTSPFRGDRIIEIGAVEIQAGKLVNKFHTLIDPGTRIPPSATATDGKTYQVAHYNLDVIISVGYPVKSKRGTQFRIWATSVLKEHLIKGFTLNQRRLAEKGLGEARQMLELLADTLESHRLVSDDVTKDLIKQASSFVAELLGKPESYVIIAIKTGRAMSFAGSGRPTAFVEVKSIGLPAAKCNELAGTISGFIEEHLEISPDRVFIDFVDLKRDMFALNGKTLDKS